jgi:hypothetical protein
LQKALTKANEEKERAVKDSKRASEEDLKRAEAKW